MSRYIFALFMFLLFANWGDLAISTDRFEEINLGIVPAMKIDLQEVLADDTEFRGLDPSEVKERLYAQFFSDLQKLFARGIANLAIKGFRKSSSVFVSKFDVASAVPAI